MRTPQQHPHWWWCPLKPRHGNERDDGQQQRADNTGQALPGEMKIPRQRNADTPRLTPPGTTKRNRHDARSPGRATRLLTRTGIHWARVAVGMWWRAAWVYGVTNRTYLGSGAQHARAATCRAVGWCGPVVGRAAAAARWSWVRVVRPAVITTGQWAVRVGVWGWRRVEPCGRDAAGWLVHTAPGLVGRLLVRLARWLPVAVVRVLRHAVLGLGWLLTRWGRYCLAYPEYAGIVREARELDRPRRARVALVAWRRAATRRSLATLVMVLAGWLGLWWLDATHGTFAVVAVGLGLVAVLALIGRAVRPLPDPEPGQQPDQPGPEDPYPIADAHTRTDAADCVRRALVAEAIVLRAAGEARRTPWGWEVAVVLRSGTPAGIVTKTGNLETHLDLPAGGLLVTPDRTRRARVVLRLAERDPFTGLGPPPVRGRVSITERAVIGARIDGSPLAVPLLGVHGVVIGSSGAGKSTTLRTLTDAVAACVDALVWDLDPAGCGLEALGPGVGRRERDPAGITDALADALALAQARPRMLAELGMGAAWIPSPARPAVVVVVDEYPRLTEKAKALAVALLRVGRKARVTLLLAATEATADALGAAIADTTALAILHACRHTDVRLVLGPQMLAEGWRPDRLHPATADDPGEAGRAYVATAGNREPLISAIHPLDESEAHERGAARAALGLPRIDPPSWAAARAGRHHTNTTEDPAKPAETAETGSGALPDRDDVESLRHAATMLSVFGADDRLWTEDLLARLAERDPVTYRGWDAEALSTVLRRFGITPTQIWRQGRNRRGYLRADIAHALGHDDTPRTAS
jgi:S-DNA-T family DNA segregation ATPase FtsK/SpoIIIE